MTERKCCCIAIFHECRNCDSEVEEEEKSSKIEKRSESAPRKERKHDKLLRMNVNECVLYVSLKKLELWKVC